MKSLDKRKEIISVAMELLAENGFHGVPMSMIAARANVAVGTIYRYFTGKDELIDALFQELEASITAAIRERFPTTGSIRERFLYLNGIILRYLIDNPLHFRYLEQYMNSPYGVSMRRDRLLEKEGRNDIFMTLFEEAIAARIVKDIPINALFFPRHRAPDLSGPGPHSGLRHPERRPDPSDRRSVLGCGPEALMPEERQTGAIDGRTRMEIDS